MINKVKDIFVTAAIYIEHNEPNICSLIKKISKNLSENYAHYEILIVGDARVLKETEDEINKMLKNIYFIRFIKAFGIKKQDTLEAIAFENAIGDIVVVGSLFEIVDSNVVNDFILTCCSGYDVVMSNSIVLDHRNDLHTIMHKAFKACANIIDGYRSIPCNFTGMCCASRRAINAASKLPRFEKFPFLHLSSAMKNVKVLDINHLLAEKDIVSSANDLLDVLSYNTNSHISLLCISAFITSCIMFFISFFTMNACIIISLMSIDLFAILFFMNCSLKRLIDNKTDVEQYSIEYDKHSSVMLDLTELNIRSDSTSDMVNKVQTGRDR